MKLFYKLNLCAKYLRVHAVIVIMVFGHHFTRSVSIVYNMRIAQTTRRQLVNNMHPISLAATTALDQFRVLRNGTHQNTAAGLGTYIYTQSKGYARVDWAVGNVRATKDEIRFSRTQSDDVLVSAGYSHEFNDNTRATLSGLVGIPTHDDDGLQGIQFGTGHASVGAQLDASYTYHDDRMLMAAARIIRFFPRTVDFNASTRNTRFNISLGNLADLLFTHSFRWGRHKLEIGYNPTFAFGARVCPEFDNFNDRLSFIRSSVFAAYQYNFLIGSVANAIIIGFSCGCDHNKSPFHIKWGCTSWFTWGISF